MEKKMRYNVRDALPKTPESFYDAVERSLESCRAQKTERSWGGLRLKKKWLIPLVAAAVLLIGGTAVAAGVWLRDNYSPGNYMETTREEREQKGQTIPDVEQAIASAAPQSGNYYFVMLPEFKNAQTLDDFRVRQGQPRYSEADWAWIRDIRPEVEEVLIDSRTLNINIRLNTDHAQAFKWPDVEGQWLDALTDSMSFRKEGDSMAYPIAPGGGGINPNMVTDTGATLFTEVILDQPDVDFPTEGRVELTVEIGLRDARVEDLSPMGNVAKLFYTFSFDVGAGADVAPAQINQRNLAGSYVLTVDDWTDPNKPSLYNQRVSLDDVTLQEEVRYRQTGVYVTYTVKSAPAGWTEALTNALLYSNREGKYHGLYIQYRMGQEGEWLDVGHENHGNFGESVIILPIFPSEYAQAKQQGVYLRLVEDYGVALNGEPIAEDWKMVLGEGSMSLNFTVSPQELLTIELPLP